MQCLKCGYKKMKMCGKVKQFYEMFLRYKLGKMYAFIFSVFFLQILKNYSFNTGVNRFALLEKKLNT